MGNRTCVHGGTVIMSCDTDHNRWLELNLIYYLSSSAVVAVHISCIVSATCKGGRAWGASAVARRGNLRCSKVRSSMAQSKMEKVVGEGNAHGLMIKASAYIVKYAKDEKVRLRPGDSGVHKKNRGGEYPAGLRGKALLVEISKIGIIQDEVDQHAYAVEEMPLEKILERKDHDFTSMLEYNTQQCAKDELLSGIYDEPYNKVYHGLLAHNLRVDQTAQKMRSIFG